MLSADMLVALIAFAFVTSITPGPNNLMLLASGLNFGVRRTVPHMLGIGIGFAVMIVAVGLGLGEIFTRVPVLYAVLKYAGAAYMLWLAWRIARTGPKNDDGLEGKAHGQPMTFLEAAAFQWVNPKAWIMALAAIATYTVPDEFALSVVVVGLVFGVVNGPCVATWAIFGSVMRRFLNDPQMMRIFNVTMAVLLVASLYPLLTEHFR